MKVFSREKYIETCGRIGYIPSDHWPKQCDGQPVDEETGVVIGKNRVIYNVDDNWTIEIPEVDK